MRRSTGKLGVGESSRRPRFSGCRGRRQRSIRRGAALRLERVGEPPQFKAVTGISTGALIAPPRSPAPVRSRAAHRLHVGGSVRHRKQAKPTGGDQQRWDGRQPAALGTDLAVHRRASAREDRGRACQGAHPPGGDDEPRRVPAGDLEHGEDRGQRRSGALHLFRTILLASAAIPGAFPRP